MIWVGWRQQRTETVIAAGILCLLTLLLLPSGLEMASAYHRDGLSHCLGQDPSSSCARAIDSFTSRFESTSNLIGWFTLVPGVIGALLAAPFVLELEQGTYRLAWTQSITRRRWIAGKLGLAVGAALLAALALTLLVTWWRSPFVHLQGRLDGAAFDSEGTVVFGYTLFALGLAAAVGVVWRRAVPALMVAFAGYFAARLFVDIWLRQRLVAPLTATWSVSGHTTPANLNHAWVLTQHPSDRFGNLVSVPLGRCVRLTGNHGKIVDPACLAAHGSGYMHAVYHPASHFWTLQLIETGLFAGAALVLIGFAAWWTHRRVA